MKYDQIVLLGDSHIQWATECSNGITRILADAYERKADIMLRGYVGYDTTELRLAWPYIRDTLLAGKVRAIVVFIGSNDSAIPGDPQHVPLEKTLRNTRELFPKLQAFASNVIFVTPGLMNNSVFARTDELAEKYATEMAAVAKELGVTVVNVREVFGPGNFQYLRDGLHYTNEGYQLVGDAVLEALKGLSLDPEKMQAHLPDHLAMYGKSDEEIMAMMEAQQ